MQNLKSNADSIIHDHLNYFTMYRRFSDYTLLSYFLFSCFELWFDQAYHLCVCLEQIVCRSQNFSQRNERYIYRCKIQIILNILSDHVSEVCLFHTDNTFIIAKFPCQLSVSNVYRVYLHSAILKHTVREASCRSANIHAHFTFQRYIKLLHSLG